MKKPRLVTGADGGGHLAYGFGFLGRPPFFPLSRAARALAALVDCPPLRPSAAAAAERALSLVAIVRLPRL